MYLSLKFNKFASLTNVTLGENFIAKKFSPRVCLISMNKKARQILMAEKNLPSTRFCQIRIEKF